MGYHIALDGGIGEDGFPQTRRGPGPQAYISLGEARDFRRFMREVGNAVGAPTPFANVWDVLVGNGKSTEAYPPLGSVYDCALVLQHMDNVPGFEHFKAFLRDVLTEGAAGTGVRFV